jgi:beta-galactosidase
VNPPADFFPYGAMHMATISHWQHYLPPVEEWAAWMGKDIANMKKVGMNALAVHVDWYDIEVAPGQYDFTRLDRLMDMAEANGLRVLLWPWPELQPDWVPRHVKGSEWVASDDYKPGQACWDHPEVRAMIDKFVRAVVARYKDRPSVLAWDLGAEAGIWVASNGPVDKASDARLFCYCPHTVARYRDWLRGKYGTLDKLNETWATYYTDWQQVMPVRAGIFERAQTVWLDWRQFMLWNTAEFQRIKVEAARQTDAVHPITAHIGGWGYGYVYSCTDEYEIARHFDVFSLSLFPFWLERSFGAYDASIGAMNLDGTRSASGGKPMWIEELQGGPSIYGLNYRSRFPTPGDIRVWVWQSIAHGATGIFYWNWRPETTGIEASGFGLVNYDGSLTDRANEAGKVGLELQKHAQRLLASHPEPARIAILHDPRTFLLAHGEQDVGSYVTSLRGTYRALFRAGLPVDILVPPQLHTTDLSRYQAIYLPFAYVLSREDGRRLAEYVANGGALFASLFCGLKDDRTFLYETVPGAGLDKVFHCRQEQVNPAPVEGMTVTQADELTPSLPVGTKIPVYRWQERVQVDPEGRVVATFSDQSPALVAGKYGKGKTLYAGSLLPWIYDQKADATVGKLLVDFATAAGVQPSVRVHTEPADKQVEARVLVAANGRRLVIAINHAWANVAADLTLAGPQPARASNLLTGEAIVLAPSDRSGGSAMHLAIPGRDVCVVALDP